MVFKLVHILVTFSLIGYLLVTVADIFSRICSDSHTEFCTLLAFLTSLLKAIWVLIQKSLFYVFFSGSR